MTMRGSFVPLLKWSLALAAVAFACLALVAFQRARNVHDVMATGTEAVAAIEGGAAGIRQAVLGSYAVDLVWVDAAGAAHESSSVWINGALAKQLREASGGEAATLMIKYLDGQPPVIVRQAAHDQERNRADIVRGAAGAVLAGLVAAVLAWRSRRSSPARR